MRKILVPLTGYAVDQRAVSTAFLMARHLGASLEGVSVLPPYEVRVPVDTAGLPSFLAEEFNRIGHAQQDHVAEDAHVLFEATHADYADVAASWERLTGPPAERIAARARFADLLVTAQSAQTPAATARLIETALLASGRPLLLAPVAAPTTIATGVAIAWDGGVAAVRAVTAAMVILRKAAAVHVLTVKTAETADPERADTPALAAYLALHGVRAEIHGVALEGRAVSTTLLQSAQALGCDLLVMGGYGHSRLREMVLGGVTHDMLRGPHALPIFMAH